MGKIHDALEKMQKKQSPTDILDEQPEPKVYAAEPEIHEPEPINAVLPKGVPIKSTLSLDSSLITWNAPNSFESEQFKLIRNRILFPESGKSFQSVMITSAVPGEGKSFVSANLAISIARNINQHVLLIDCDMRRPSIHRMFGFERVPGLTNYLENNTPLHTLLLKTTVEKLTILPVGDPPPNPAELLSSKKMFDLLYEVKNRYNDRYIIIDLPPPKLTSETEALARLVDGILLVIEYGSTKRELIMDLIRTLGKDKIIGVVFNRYDDWVSGQYYGYKKYDKYYKKYKYL